jgi:hypothetical protein
VEGEVMSSRIWCMFIFPMKKRKKKKKKKKKKKERKKRVNAIELILGNFFEPTSVT